MLNVFFLCSQEASTEVFKEKRALDQMRVTLNDVTAERNSLSEELKLLQSQVSFDVVVLAFHMAAGKNITIAVLSQTE